jgi:2-amino-4-hydroxy-6-hydroxymethyldihydropteridine diphosphokinase
MADTSYAIALGSNRRHGRHGAPERVIFAAIAALGEAGLRVSALSPIIRTAAWGPAGRGFANAAALIETPLDPPALLRLLKRVEQDFGRRRGRRWGQRVLDLDIILWSGGTWPPFPARAAPGRLAIPHAGLARRPFVLTPLAAIAAGWRDPMSGRTIRQLHARLTAPRALNRETPFGEGS